MAFIEFRDVTEYNTGSTSIAWLPLIGVCLAAVLSWVYIWWTKYRAIKKNGELYDIYLKSLLEDLKEQIDEIKAYRKSVTEYELTDAIIDGAFMFDFAEKIDFLLLKSHFKKRKIKDHVEYIVEVVGGFSAGKNELKKLAEIVADYEASSMNSDENFYDMLIKFQKNVKTYRDSTYKTITSIDKANLKTLQEIIDKYLDKECQYDLATYIEFDTTFISEIIKHPFSYDNEHKLYLTMLNFADDWHIETTKAQNKRDLHLDRVHLIEINVETVNDTLSAYKIFI